MINSSMTMNNTSVISQTIEDYQENSDQNLFPSNAFEKSKQD